jgi:hypothetical protein
VVGRHADAAPAYVPFGPLDERTTGGAWSWGANQLTPRGFHQSYLFGRYLRQTYLSTISSTAPGSAYCMTALKSRVYLRAIDHNRVCYWGEKKLFHPHLHTLMCVRTFKHGRAVFHMSPACVHLPLPRPYLRPWPWRQVYSILGPLRGPTRRPPLESSPLILDRRWQCTSKLPIAEPLLMRKWCLRFRRQCHTINYCAHTKARYMWFPRTMIACCGHMSKECVHGFVPSGFDWSSKAKPGKPNGEGHALKVYVA